MSIIDENQLVEALQRAAEEFDISLAAVNQLERAIADPSRESLVTRWGARVPNSRRARVLSVAVRNLLAQLGVARIDHNSVEPRLEIRSGVQ